MSAQVFSFDAPLPKRLYWDASFLVHATYPAGRYHQACFHFLARLSKAPDVISYISTLTLDETIFILLRLKVEESLPGQRFWSVYRRNPYAIRPYLGEIRALLHRLFVDPRIRVVGLEPESMLLVPDYMERYALLPRDALHLTTMVHWGLDAVVTTDTDFLNVDDLHIYTCNPRILSRASSP